MPEPWASSTFLFAKDNVYDRWDARWTMLAARLDALERETKATGQCDSVYATYLVESIKHAELIRESAALTERFHVDATTLRRLNEVETWTLDAICSWFGLSKAQRRALDLRGVKFPREVVVRVAIPLVLPHIKSRQHRAWILTLGELLAALA